MIRPSYRHAAPSLRRECMVKSRVPVCVGSHTTKINFVGRQMTVAPDQHLVFFLPDYLHESVSTRYRCHCLCHLQMSLGQGGAEPQHTASPIALDRYGSHR